MPRVMTASSPSLSIRCALLALVCLVVPAAARAQTFVSPFIGAHFRDEKSCQPSTACADNTSSIGVSFGNLNALIGFEEELNYGKNFFTEAPPQTTSSVLSVMSNVVIGPRISYVRVFGTGGFGLVRARVGSSKATTANNVGWNIGGGAMMSFGHFGVRGDVRFYRSLTELGDLGLSPSTRRLRYGRVSIGLVIQ